MSLRRQQPQIVVSIVRKDDKVLMIERRNIDGVDGYVFPGGRVEASETPGQAAEREVMEETSMRCRAVREIGRRVHPSSGVKLHYWLCDFVDEVKGHVPEFPILWTKVEHLDALAGPSLFPDIKSQLLRHPA